MYRSPTRTHNAADNPQNACLKADDFGLFLSYPVIVQYSPITYIATHITNITSREYFSIFQNTLYISHFQYCKSVFAVYILILITILILPHFICESGLLPAIIWLHHRGPARSRTAVLQSINNKITCVSILYCRVQ